MEIVSEQSRGRYPVEANRPEVGPRKGKSALTNGKRLLLGVDHRNPWVRRFKDLLNQYIADLGGADNCSAAERSILRRASVLETELERMETKFALAVERGSEVSIDNLDAYARIAANHRRQLEAVGLQRRPREVQELHGPNGMLTQLTIDVEQTNSPQTGS
jgi:DNA polymerase/3'-5' exonuclease PolX